jgi:hypothetical protein
MWNGAGLGRALFVLLLGVAGAQGCGDSDDDSPQTNTTGARPQMMGSGGSSRGGSGGRASAGEGGADTGEGGAAGVPTQQPGGPLVRVLSPNAVEKPSDGGVLVDGEIDVVCEVRKSNLPGAQEIEPGSVTVQLLDANGVLVDTVAADPGETTDQFVARLIVAKVEDTGRLTIVCGAGDRSVPPLAGIGQIETFIDHGPIIDVERPRVDSRHALGAVPFRFSVKADPLVRGEDPEAEVDDVTLELGGVRIQDLEENDGEYVATVDLLDRELFPNPPAGTLPVTIRATNRRKPEPVETLLSYDIVIDGKGPKISVVTPTDSAVVGGRVPVTFTIEDDFSDVDEASVVVFVNLEEHRFKPGDGWSRSGDSFTFTLETAEAEKTSFFQVSVNISAADEVGNEAQTESLLLFLDNQPPIVDLDPPNLRETRKAGDTLECTRSFDPVGTAPPNDLDTVPRAVLFRALVWEQTNYEVGQTVVHYAGTDRESVYLYLQPNAEAGFVRDSNGDGTCDDLRADADDLPTLHLSNLSPMGTSWFGAELPEDQLPPLPSVCTLKEESEPTRVCDDDSDMFRVIANEKGIDGGQNSPIFAYGIGPGPTCTGLDWDIGIYAEAEGWVCLAARSLDNAKNRGVSRPLRLCFDDPRTPERPACVDDKSSPPTCTDGCTTLPPAFFYNSLLELN